MDCPLCTAPTPGWHHLHRHLADQHADAVTRVQRTTGPPGFIVHCPACDWAFEKLLQGQRSDQTFVDQFRAEMVLVAFDQFMVHWVADHVVEPAEERMEDSGDS